MPKVPDKHLSYKRRSISNSYSKDVNLSAEQKAKLSRKVLSIQEHITYFLHVKLGEYSKKWLTHLFLLVAMIIYTAVGATLYAIIEGGSEAAQVRELLNQRKEVMTQIQELVTSGSPQLLQKSEELIKKYEGQLVEHFDKNSKILTKGDDELNWSFWGAAFFCGTIYTTIGYGHLAPLTTAGRALTIVYALIGVPLFLTVLADFGKLLTRLIKHVWVYCSRIYYTGSLKKPQHMGTDEDNMGDSITDIIQMEDEIDFSLPISLALSVFLFYMFIGALIYYLWEGWTFLEAFYFIFISMATIGFGDFVPSTHFYMMALIVYLVCGLAITSMCINVVREKLAETFEHATARIGETVRLELMEEHDEHRPPPAFGQPQTRRFDTPEGFKKDAQAHQRTRLE